MPPIRFHYDSLAVDLAPIDGGEERVLQTRASLICRYAVSRELERIAWRLE
jgi:hypothetical protein